MTDYAIKIPNQSPNIHFHGRDGGSAPMLIIRNDGKIVIGEGYELDEVATRFWEIVQTTGVNIRKQVWLEAAKLVEDAQYGDDLLAALEAKANEP